MIRSPRVPRACPARPTPARTSGFLRSVLGLALVWFAVSPTPSAGAATAPSRPDVLFIVIDDLNHWVGHLGRHLQAKTPNIDRLAARGTTFIRAYSAAPACNPSRTALFSGLRPSTSGVYDNPTPWTPHIARGLTLNEHLRAHGYLVEGVGKIYHGGSERPEDWDAFVRVPGAEPDPKGSPGVGGIKFAPLDCEDTAMTDHRSASWAIDRLALPRERPLFLAVGFHKPHMPWNVPQKYFDLHPTNKLYLPPYQENDLDDLPPAGVAMARAAGDHEAILKSGRWRDAVQGYLAAIAFVDAQVGRLLDALDQSPRRNNTLVVLCGDHGWHLGEKHHWRKFALWEEATRTPLIWVAPGLTSPGSRCRRTVELLSVYPTLCDLAGIPIPAHLEGRSLRPLLADPKAEWTTPALTTHGFQNHAVRTEEWRFIRYADGSEELYDETRDPFEWRNQAGLPETSAVRAELARWFPKVNTPAPAPSTDAGPTRP